MAQATIIPSKLSIRHQFEELPLFWQFEPTTGTKPAVTWRGGMIDGEFEVEYDIFSKDWHVSDLWISADNGQIGAAAKGSLINLNADVDERLYLLVLDIVTFKYEQWIEERISEEISQLRYAA